MKNSVKHSLSLLILGLGSFSFWATGPNTTEPLIVPNFSYSAPTASEANSANLTMALIRPKYAGGRSIPVEPFASFVKSLEDETIEVLTNRGYSLRGPFDSRDEMVYSDKEACDLALIIEIEPQVKKISGAWYTVKLANGGVGYRLRESVIAVYGKINMSAIEPITGEKMWSKSVDIPQKNTTLLTASSLYTGSSLVDEDRIAALIVANDPTVLNPITVVLQESFSDIMNKINAFLEPTEFQRMKPKIAELKAKG